MTCVACGAPLYCNNIERHHFPLSKKNGGTATVDLCTSCHNMIERVPITKWPVDYASKALAVLAGQREAFLLFAKLYWVAQEADDGKG